MTRAQREKALKMFRAGAWTSDIAEDFGVMENEIEDIIRRALIAQHRKINKKRTVSYRTRKKASI